MKYEVSLIGLTILFIIRILKPGLIDFIGKLSAA